MKKVLITGNRGYIGSLLCKKLKKENFFVNGVDTNWFTKKNKYPEFVDHQINCDISKLSILDLKDVDYIVHLAAISNDPMSEEFKKVTSTFANSQIAGLQVNKVFEDCEKGSKQCEIALAMAWSENSAALANSIFNSIPSIAPKGNKGKPIIERIPKSHNQVLANIGARLYLDENGEYHIIPHY